MCRPTYQEYQVPVKWTTFKPEYTQHVREMPYTVYHQKMECYQVPVKWTTCRPVYTKHEWMCR